MVGFLVHDVVFGFGRVVLPLLDDVLQEFLSLNTVSKPPSPLSLLSPVSQPPFQAERQQGRLALLQRAEGDHQLGNALTQA
jgi:hypothetical protein